ncbi:MAG: hypothetical protein LUG51_02075 [Tannerellaceae bacterium]|nr:hypothetical protein [Tannerellaceae bacterium]
MKKSIIYLMLLTIAFIACEPIENRESAGGAITADQLDISATPIVVNGKNSNRIILQNNSPVLSQWDYGNGLSTRSYDEVDVVLTGDLTVIFTGLNADGSKITKELPIRVDELTYEVPEEWALLCGTGSKDWTWSDEGEVVWGNGDWNNGGYFPNWWGIPKDGMEEQAPGEGAAAYMTFSISGAKLTKTYSDGSVDVGSFSFNMNEQVLGGDDSVWAKGILNTNNVTVLNGISPNEDNAKVYQYYILRLDENNLVLSHKVTHDWGDEGWYWVFKAK